MGDGDLASWRPSGRLGPWAALPQSAQPSSVPQREPTAHGGRTAQLGPGQGGARGRPRRPPKWLGAGQGQRARGICSGWAVVAGRPGGTRVAHSGLSCPFALPRGPAGPRPHPGAPAPRQILRLSIFLFQDSGPNKVSRPLGLRGGIVRPHGRGARRPLPAEVGATSFTRVCARSLRAPLRAWPCRATAGLWGPRRGRGGRRQAGDGKITIVTRRGEACGGDDGL